MAKLFVSYSRRDSVAARKLIEAFRSIEQDVWVDWESIPPAVDWLEQIFRGIETADAFIFLISPDSIVSEVCKVEINKAAQNNKRIIPIVLRDVSPKDAPETISKLNWTFMRETDHFEEGLAKVKTAIELDLDWLEEHRRLQVRALEWHRKKDVSLLLRGRDLRNARRMVETATSKDPTPTDLQKTYIQHSLRSERNRTAAWISGSVALIIMAILSVIAVNRSIAARTQQKYAEANAQEANIQAVYANLNRRKAERNAEEANKQKKAAEDAKALAEENETEAEAQRSAAKSQIYLNRPGELYTSTLLAIDSMRRRPSDEAEEILRRNISLLPLPVAQFAQAGKINALAFSPDGNTFVTASDDGTACAWSIEEEQISNPFCTLKGQAGVTAAAFSPDGSFLVTGDQAGLVQVLEPKTGKVLHAFQRVEQSGPVQMMELKNGSLPDGYTARGKAIRNISVRPTKAKLIVVAYEDGEIPVFDANTGKINSRLSIVNRPNVTRLSPLGSWLMAGSENGQVTIWNLGNRNRFSPSTHRGGVLAVDFSPKATKMVTAGANTISVSNLSTEKELYRIPVQSPVRDIAFEPNGSWFVTGSDDHRIRVWDTFTGNEQLAMSQDGVVTDVVVSSDSRWIASTGDDRTARVWDAQTGAEMFQIPLKSSGSKLAFVNQDKWLVSAEESGAIAFWNISVMTLPELSMRFDGIVNQVQYSPSGKWLAASVGDKLWLLSPQSILKERQLGQPAEDFGSNIVKLAFSQDSKLIGILTNENEVAVYNVEGDKLQSIAASEQIQSIAFTPDSQQLITSDMNGNLQAWNVLSGELLPGADKFPQGPSLASAKEVLAVGSQDKITILNADADGSSSAIESSGTNTLLVFSADGSRLASNNSGGEISIFNYDGSQFLKSTSFTKEQATSLAFNTDGSLLAVGTAQNVYLMDASTGKEVARIPHLSTVNGVSFSPDGKDLATASSQVLQFWKLSDIHQVKSDDLIRAACSYLYENFSQAQWDQFFAGEDYQPLCENLAP